MAFNIKLLSDRAIPPKRGSEHAAGYDLATPRDFTINDSLLVDLEQSWEIPEGYYGKIFPRSGLAVKHITVDAGVIDSDYRGSVKVLLVNGSGSAVDFKAGDRIAQLIIHQYFAPEVTIISELSQTKRGEGGFGSTGR